MCVLNVICYEIKYTGIIIMNGPRDKRTARLIRVDGSGNGDFKKIQQAIDSVPSQNNELVFIWVKPGTYR